MATTKKSAKPRPKAKSASRSVARAPRKVSIPANSQRETVGIIIFTILAISFLVLVIAKYM